MVPLAPNGSHIFLWVDRDADMQRFHESIRNRRLNPNDFDALCRETSFLLRDQLWTYTGQTYSLCKRCGESCGQNAVQLWQMHPCGALKVTLLCDGGGQSRLAEAAEALANIREKASRLRSVGAWMLWDIVSEHVIELYLQHYTHTRVDLGALLDARLISPRVLHAAPRREEFLRGIIADTEEFEDWSDE